MKFHFWANLLNTHWDKGHGIHTKWISNDGCAGIKVLSATKYVCVSTNKGGVVSHLDLKCADQFLKIHMVLTSDNEQNNE